MLLLSFQLGQALVQPANVARDIVGVEYATLCGFVERARGNFHGLTSFFHVARFEQYFRVLDLRARFRTPSLVALALLVIAADTLDSRLMISQQ